MDECQNCKGKGKVVNGSGLTVTCFECDGTGEKCPNCGESAAACNGYECQSDEE
jgi:hypothetical protein